jgi:N-acetyl-gamma-glutamyl-phosphate reductase
MLAVGIVGATGYAGAELVRILAGHPQVDLRILTSRQYAGQAFSDIYPAFQGLTELVCQPYDSQRISAETDLVFTALPHQIPMSIVPGLLANGLRVIDLSADYRFENAADYEAHYEPHQNPELLTKAVYGLSEVYRDSIKSAQLIGNPGCYPTSVLLPLVPLLKAGLIDGRLLIADAKSGVSGAGRTPSLVTHFCEVHESFKAYKVADHRHNPEMDAILSKAADRPLHISFVPHLVPMSRGMLTTIYTQPQPSVTAAQIDECLQAYFDPCPFVRLLGWDRFPSTRAVRGTNYCDIGYRLDPRGKHLILIAAIDNLVKGAAGQAVQNMNLMMGWDESMGLDAPPFPL